MHAPTLLTCAIAVSLWQPVIPGADSRAFCVQTAATGPSMPVTSASCASDTLIYIIAERDAECVTEHMYSW